MKRIISLSLSLTLFFTAQSISVVFANELKTEDAVISEAATDDADEVMEDSAGISLTDVAESSEEQAESPTSLENPESLDGNDNLTGFTEDETDNNISRTETAAEEFNYTNYDEYIEITGLRNPQKVINNLVIPSVIDGKPVKNIGDEAFKNCTNLKGTLIIPNSVTYIGCYAFSGCSGFTGSLTIPNSVTTIGWCAFSDCSGFTGSLTIPNSVTIIMWSAFSGCSGFTGSLKLPNSITTIEDSTFSGCSGFTGSLTIPNSVTSIGEQAFAGCKGFTGSLTIPNSVTIIMWSAFSGCSGFTGSLKLPNSITTIEDYTFSGCSGFTGSLIIPNSVTSIGSSAFSGCSGFTGSLTIPNGVTSIGSLAFSDCNGFTGSLTIPNSTSVCGGAFSGCSGFTGRLKLPKNLESIGNEAFSGCSGFTGRLKLPNNLKSIGNEAFSGCSGFTGKLKLPNSVTSIGYRAFSDCSGFTSVNIPYDVDTISRCAFSRCYGLKNVEIEGAEHIEEEAFIGCTGLSGKLILPKTLKEIGTLAFGDCCSITELTIPAGIKSIAGVAFKGCYGVKKVILKSSEEFNFSQLLRDEKEYFKNEKTGKRVDGYVKKKGTYVKTDFSKPKKTSKPSVVCVNDGLKITWEGQRGVTGYYVYRNTNGSKFKKTATVRDVYYEGTPWDPPTATFIDKQVRKGNKYAYKICAYVTVGKKTIKGAMSEPKEAYYLSAPSITSIESSSPKCITVKWKGSSKYSGYEIQCSRSNRFKDYKSIKINSGKTTSKKISGLWSGRQCYVRIRAIKKSEGKTYRGPWSQRADVFVQ